MSKDDVSVEILCRNESKVVGIIAVPVETGKRGYLLSSRVIWGGFRPVTEEYRLPRKMQGDGQVLSCPRCMGMLCIKGDNPTKKAETDKVIAAREEARKRILEQAKNDGEVHEHLPSHGVDADMAPIILGKTRISAR